MKRVLIITYYWPPSGGSGVQRWLKFSKYLPEFGWQPVVYTPENPDFEIKDNSLLSDIPAEAEIIRKRIWEPYQLYKLLTGAKDSKANFGMTDQKAKQSFMKRLSLWARGNIFVPDPRIFWVKPSIRFLKKYITNNHIDVLVTTGPPHSLHLIGLGLKKHFPSLPWIADMRDPWSLFDVHSSFLSESGKRKNEEFERKVMESADRVITVTPSLYEEFLPFEMSKHVLLTNGYDTEDFPEKAAFATDKSIFKIVHSGLLSSIRNPQALWEALESLCQKNAAFAEKFQLELIGHVDNQVISSIEKHKFLSQRYRVREWMEHEELLKENQTADLFLLLVNKSRNAKAQLTGKIFEYLAQRKPVFAVCPANSDALRLLHDTQMGTGCEHGQRECMEKALLEFFNNWLMKKPFEGNYKEIEAYSRRNLTKKLAGLMEDVVFSTPPIA